MDLCCCFTSVFHLSILTIEFYITDIRFINLKKSEFFIVGTNISERNGRFSVFRCLAPRLTICEDFSGTFSTASPVYMQTAHIYRSCYYHCYIMQKRTCNKILFCNKICSSSPSFRATRKKVMCCCVTG